MTQTFESIIFGAIFGITWSVFDGDFDDFDFDDSDSDDSDSDSD